MTDSTERLIAIIEREDDGDVGLSSESGIASQSGNIDGARANLVEALTLLFERASATEWNNRLCPEVLVAQVQAPVG